MGIDLPGTSANVGGGGGGGGSGESNGNNNGGQKEIYGGYRIKRY